MSMRKLKLIGVGLLLLGTFSSVSADKFYKSGTITRVLVDSTSFGGCMVKLSTPINNGCPASGWVSLDCTNTYYTDGKNKYAMALTALSLNKSITVRVDNELKHNTYCVAQRVDIY